MGRLSLLFGSPRRTAQDLAVATGVGVFLGVIGPFGSFYGGGVELRIVYWTLNLWIGYAFISVLARLSLAAARRLDIPSWFSLAVGVAVGAAPLSVVIHAVAALIWPPSRHGSDPWPVLYAQCLVMAEPLSFAYALLIGRGVLRDVSAPAAAPARTIHDAAPERRPAGSQVFLDRLPPRLGRDLLCLTMEDHYVRAHTALGSDLVLIPLKEAMAELDDHDGLQVHRSAWVARSAVKESVQSGRAVSLRLTNGLLVPVSRTSVARLKAAGWL